LRAVLVTLGDPGQLTGGYLYHRRMAAAAPRHGAWLGFASFPERPFPLAALAAPKVMRHVYAQGADALVLDSIAAAFLGASPVTRRPRLPIVGMLHQPPGGIDHGPLRTTIQAWLDRRAYRHVSLLMVASESLEAWLMAEGVSRDRLRVVPPGRDYSVTDSAASAEEPEAAKPRHTRNDLRQGRRAALLCVGNWVERKGIHYLLEALARLPAESATLHLVGDDQADPRYARRLHARVTLPDLAKRVVVHGPLDVAGVTALYEAADVFVLPSLKEPYGTVYGEAMAAGLPVVGWRAGNLPYLADHEREGLILEPGDVTGLADALSRLACDEALRRRLGEAGRQRALARPTWDEAAAMFFGAIREVVERRSSCPNDSQDAARLSP
jgi:glycosyltransferase involved in cell wall biosynthesis